MNLLNNQMQQSTSIWLLSGSLIHTLIMHSCFQFFICFTVQRYYFFLTPPNFFFEEKWKKCILITLLYKMHWFDFNKKIIINHHNHHRLLRVLTRTVSTIRQRLLLQQMQPDRVLWYREIRLAQSILTVSLSTTIFQSLRITLQTS